MAIKKIYFALTVDNHLTDGFIISISKVFVVFKARFSA